MQALAEARNKVNGEFLSNNSGKPISIVGKVVKVKFSLTSLPFIL